jgi:hypothetical protein
VNKGQSFSGRGLKGVDPRLGVLDPLASGISVGRRAERFGISDTNTGNDSLILFEVHRDVGCETIDFAVAGALTAVIAPKPEGFIDVDIAKFSALRFDSVSDVAPASGRDVSLDVFPALIGLGEHANAGRKLDVIRLKECVKDLEFIGRPVGYQILCDPNDTDMVLRACPISARLKHGPKICSTHHALGRSARSILMGWSRGDWNSGWHGERDRSESEPYRAGARKQAEGSPTL